MWKDIFKTAFTTESGYIMTVILDGKDNLFIDYLI